jgi:hypothetical protein
MAETTNSYGIGRHEICGAVHYMAARLLGWAPKEAACLALLRAKLGPVDKVGGPCAVPDDEPMPTTMFAGIVVTLTHDAIGLVDAASANDSICTPTLFHSQVEEVFGALWLPILAQCHAMLDTEGDVTDAYAKALDQWQEQDFLDKLAAEPCAFVDYDDGEEWDEEEDEQEDETAAA